MRGAMFVAAIIVIVQFFPDEKRFKYHYQKGKPWQYGLLTAPFDFPIYKEDAQLQAEQDSILRRIKPYFRVDSEVVKNQIAKFNKNVFSRDDSSEASFRYKKYIEEKLKYVYNANIISSADLEKLSKENKTEINVVKDRIVSTRDVGRLFTVKSAYNYIMNNIPDSFDPQIIKSYNINNYLVENIFLDENTTREVMREEMQNMSLTMGIVQAGERIIGKGEIVTSDIFQQLNSLKRETESRTLSGETYNLLLFGQYLLVTSLMLLLFLYIFLFRQQIFTNLRRVFFILMMILLMVVLSSLTIRFTSLNIYIIPFALLPIIVRTFFDSRTALFAHIITILLVSFMVSNPYEFVLLQIAVGMTTISSLKDLTQRSQLMQTAVLIVLTYCLMFLSYSLITDGSLNWRTYFYFVINGLLLLFAYGLIYIFEKTFGFLSNVTLVELSNVNSPLMMKFSEEAPGTFQHSLQVSSLATEAAAKINANSLLIRTGALYHDIGKMTNPMYFIENQTGKMNPLLQLEYDKAAQIVINHVPEGVKIAQKNNLPKAIIDFIQTHHAQSKAKYFYNSFKNKYPDEPIDEQVFTYPGPKPFSREMAILMMADAVEAASRSLPEYTEEAIDKMVGNIIDGQIAEGSFKNAPITFQHIEIIKNLFKQKLKNIYHNRIDYPELNK